MNKKISIILGTRPDIIKLSPIIRELIKQNADFFILHTNQHFSRDMDRIFFEELRLPLPKYNLNIKERTHGKMTGEMIIKMENILNKERPNLILIEGDTNTILAAAITASKMNIKIGHVEAGLRSYDRDMPEEINRIVADHLSSLLFAPTINQEKILIREGIDKEKIHVTGNTIVDAVIQNLKIAETKNEFIHYEKENYFLLTLHRPSNVDQKQTLKQIISVMEKISGLFKTKIYFPVHPRTRKMLFHFNIKMEREKISLFEPVGYLEMLMMEKNAKMILTDSGGLQEEACILHVPCVTLRNNTERPETIEVGSNILVGNDEKRILNGAEKMLKRTKNWKNPFGDGNATLKIISAINDWD